MAGTVCYVGNQLFTFPCRSAQFTVHDGAQSFHQINVFPFVVAAYVVGFAVSPPVKYRINGKGMVLNIQPVSNIFPFSIHRQWLVVANVVNH